MNLPLNLGFWVSWHIIFLLAYLLSSVLGPGLKSLLSCWGAGSLVHLKLGCIFYNCLIGVLVRPYIFLVKAEGSISYLCYSLSLVLLISLKKGILVIQTTLIALFSLSLLDQFAFRRYYVAIRSFQIQLMTSLSLATFWELLWLYFRFLWIG